MNICILQLENNKYFVGTTDYLFEGEVLKNFKKHSNDWLDTYPIIKVIKIIPIHYFGSTKEEKAIEKYYEVKKITKIMESRYLVENVQSEKEQKEQKEPIINMNSIYPIKTIIKNNFSTELQWYEELERQQSSSSMNMFSSPCCEELYHESNNLNLEWSEKIEESQSPFEMFYLNNYYDIEGSMLKSSYL